MSDTCNGTFKDTARNIVYFDNNMVRCDLLADDGMWVHNIFKFFPQYEYYNVNGKIEWTNCRNNVEINNYSHEHIERRYKTVSIQRCLENLTSDYDEWFEIQKQYNNCVRSKCIFISLFKKNVNNTFNNEFSVDETYWKNKYYNSLINNLDNYKYTDICVNLYLASDLSHYIPEFLKYTFLNIFLMKSESVGAQPGTLWRFMHINNKIYKTVFLCDIDESWDWVNSWDNKYNRGYKLCTLKPADGLIAPLPYATTYNFATIMAGHTMIDPNKFNYNIIDVMKGFISLCKKRETSNNPYCFDDADAITFWNQPLHANNFGWGRKITEYGFDEFFLKHVIYYDAYPDFLFI
jgi:hypothetical protein